MNILRIVVGISGASGVVYGIKILESLKKLNVETHLIITRWAKVTIEEETDYNLKEVRNLADYYHEDDNLAASVSSGSFKCNGMIIAPCSMKTLSAISCGYTDNLIVRAADVTIKEKRPLVLMVRETPLSAIHLENMLKLAKLGVVIMPPVPAFYTKPETLDDIINQTVGRALEQCGIEISNLKRWGSGD